MNADLSERFEAGPVFIVGAGRSGTSVLLNTVRKTLAVPPPPPPSRLVSRLNRLNPFAKPYVPVTVPRYGEGHVFPIIRGLQQSAEAYFQRNKVHALNDRHMLHHVNEEEIQNRLAALVRDIYLDQFGGTDFVDKTPGKEGIAAIPYMQQVFPNMRVIYAQRRGLEVVRSAVLKFPKTGFLSHCATWRDCVMGWKSVRNQLECQVLEIDQFEMHHRPEKVTEQLTDFLDLNAGQSADMLEYFRTDRPQSSGALNEVPLSIDQLGWSAKQVKVFRDVCSKAMYACGYSESDTYYLDAKLADCSLA